MSILWFIGVVIGIFSAACTLLLSIVLFVAAYRGRKEDQSRRAMAYTQKVETLVTPAKR